jgi:hypothetical protein
MKEILICHISTDDNVADLFTKVLSSGARRSALVERLLYDITSVEAEVNNATSG